MTRAEVFDDIYRRNVWGGSGGGSREVAAWPFAAYASLLIKRHRLELIVDVGCGDGSVGRMIDLRGGHMVQCDVSGLAANMADGYAYDCTEEIPRGHLALVKEVTQHLSNADVRLLINKLRQFRFVLHCSALAPGADDIETGGYRPVRLKDFGLVTEPIIEWTVEGASYQMELWRPQA